jgi:hypothetical protein
MTRSAKTSFLLNFSIFFVIIFVDLRFLSFYPLTIRDPVPTGRALCIALLGGLCAGLYAFSKTS